MKKLIKLFMQKIHSMQLALSICLSLGFYVFGYAEPFLPDGNDFVVETVPLSIKTPSANNVIEDQKVITIPAPDFQSLGNDNNKLPAFNAKEQLKQLKNAYHFADEEGDFRYLGFIESQISNRIDATISGSDPVDTAILPKLLIMRATIRQHMHNFDEAIADLDSALKISPREQQALLSKAVILITQGKISDAKKICGTLLFMGTEFSSGLCSVVAGSVTGSAKKSAVLLEKLLLNTSDTDTSVKIWGYSLLGDISRNLSSDEQAENWYRKSIAQQADGIIYPLTAYADLLIDHERFDDVIKLLNGREKNTGLLIRLTIAEKNIGDSAFNKHFNYLKNYFASLASNPNPNSEAREKAIFYLKIVGDNNQALEAAVANWRMQNEFIDMRLLLESAISAHRSEMAKPVVEFVNQNHFESKIISDLIAKLNA